MHLSNLTFINLIKKKIYKFKLILFLYFLIIILSIAGLLSLYSFGGEIFLQKQIINFAISFLISLIIFQVNVEFIYKYIYILYAANIILLIYVQLVGHTSMGATRWINLFGIKFQPSESTKIILIITLSRFLSDMQSINKMRQLIIPGLMVLIPTLLIIKQPDLGTGIILFMTSSLIIFIARTSLELIIKCISYFIITLPIIWLNLHTYQKKRILVFLFNDDKLNSGYNVYQSQIAIGAGGKFGTGFQLGSQSQLGFVPENHTDFIFASFAEEFGLFASIFIIILYFIIICIFWYMATKVKNMMYRLTIIGLGGLFFLHCFINIGMVMNILPVVGIPLPFFSYGGTIVISLLGLIAFCNKLYFVDMQQK